MRWIDGALIGGVCVAGAAGLAVWRARVAVEEARVTAEREVCEEHARVSAELDAAYVRLREVVRAEPVRLAPIGEVLPGDASEAYRRARAAASGLFVARHHALSSLIDPQPLALPTLDVDALLAADPATFEALRRVGHHAHVTPTGELDELTFSGDHPWALPNLELVLLADAARRPPAACFAEVLDVARLRQVATLHEGPELSDLLRGMGRLVAATFDRCAARASTTELEDALRDARALARHPLPLGLVFALGWMDEAQDAVAFPGRFLPDGPAWLSCSSQAPPSTRRERALQADRARALASCDVREPSGAIVSWGECVTIAWEVCRLGRYCASSIVDPGLTVGDEQVWHRVMALAVATRLHHARGGLPPEGPAERGERGLWDPFHGRPLDWSREGDRVRIGFARAAEPLELVLDDGPLDAATRDPR